MTRSPLIPIFRSVSFICRLLAFASGAVIIILLVPLAVPFLDNAASFSYIRALLSADHVITGALRANIPTIIARHDMTRLIGVVLSFVIGSTFSHSADSFKGKAQYIRYKASFEEWKQTMHLSDNAIVLNPLNQKLEQLRHAGKKDREQLLRDFADTKRKLDAMGRDLAFLSIDVVDSTGMKEGEERASVEHDFREYRRLVDRTFTACGCVKATWTPDGVMSAFANVDAAVRAAREVIRNLDRFNAEVKSMRREFTVRCGVNSGFVYFDESMPLEQLSDRVLDIAAHIQKKAKPNSVCVAKPAIEPLNERSGFEPAGTMVDGYEVYEWRKEGA
ncbi:MAG TPA: guanylate cyclase [Bacteroidota bacterium]|nr:guanylate cyclase [Bacteroidota bacterium]